MEEVQRIPHPGECVEKQSVAAPSVTPHNPGLSPTAPKPHSPDRPSAATIELRQIPVEGGRISCASISYRPENHALVCFSSVTFSAAQDQQHWNLRAHDMHSGKTMAVDKGYGIGPLALSMSQDDLIAASFGHAGVRVYAIAPSVEGNPARASEVNTFREVGYATSVFFVWHRNCDWSLLSRGGDRDTDRVMLHGHLGTASPTTKQLLSTATNTLTGLSASSPGNIALLVAKEQTLQVLFPGESGLFERRCLDLSQFAATRRVGVELVPISVAIGTSHVAVGFGTVLLQGTGLVEVFEISSGRMEARRSVLNAMPFTLSCNGPRVMVGAHSSSKQACKMFLFHVKKADSFALSENCEGFWQQQTVVLRSNSFCFATCETPHGGTEEKVFMKWGSLR